MTTMQLFMGNANFHPQYQQEPEQDEEEADRHGQAYPQDEASRGR